MELTSQLLGDKISPSSNSGRTWRTVEGIYPHSPSSAKAYGNFIIGTTSFPELTLPIETNLSASQFPNFDTLFEGVVVIVGSGLSSPVKLNRVVSSGIYRASSPELMPGVLLSPFQAILAPRVYELRKQIRKFEKLCAGWDGDAAEPVGENTIETAYKVVEALLSESIANYRVPSSVVGPLPDGGLRFELRYEDREMFITVRGVNVVIQQWRPLSAIESQQYLETSAEGVQTHLEWLLA